MESPTAQTPLPEPLRPLAGLLVKVGVTLRGLSDAERRLALASVWAGLPLEEMTEREVNEALKARLAGAARFLATDYVELRRWLVDGGWLRRDSAGYAYRRVDAGALPSAAAALAGMNIDELAARLRSAHAAQRAVRREAWSARQGKPTRHPAR